MANFYQCMLRQIAPDLNPAGVEASMRLVYGTLDHLSGDTFEKEAFVAREVEKMAKGHLKGLAHSMGLGKDFDAWEAAMERDLTREQKLKAVWWNTPKDYRSMVDGVRTILVFRDGTTLVRLDDLTDAEIENRLPKT